MKGPFYSYSKYPIPNKRMQFKKEIQICLNIRSSTNVIVANQKKKKRKEKKKKKKKKNTSTMQYAFLIT